jgi:hypothetical protein
MRLRHLVTDDSPSHMHRPVSIIARTAVAEREHRSLTRSFACGESQDPRTFDRLIEKCMLSSGRRRVSPAVFVASGRVSVSYLLHERSLSESLSCTCSVSQSHGCDQRRILRAGLDHQPMRHALSDGVGIQGRNRICSRLEHRATTPRKLRYFSDRGRRALPRRVTRGAVVLVAAQSVLSARLTTRRGK